AASKELGTGTETWSRATHGSSSLERLALVPTDGRLPMPDAPSTCLTDTVEERGALSHRCLVEAVPFKQYRVITFRLNRSGPACVRDRAGVATAFVEPDGAVVRVYGNR